jgi:hypothetical protein
VPLTALALALASACASERSIAGVPLSTFVQERRSGGPQAVPVGPSPIPVALFRVRSSEISSDAKRQDQEQTAYSCRFVDGSGALREGKMVPEEESIVKPMILKGKIFLSGRQNDGPFNGPRQHLLEWFECWKAQQRSPNLIAHQLLLRNPDAI